MYVLWAEKDQYADRPASKIYEWFLNNMYEGEVVIVPKVQHGFKGARAQVAIHIKNFMKECLQ